MTYPCNVIRDLLPLYLDDVVSEESRQIVEEHLETCAGCKQCCDAMRSESGAVGAADAPSDAMLANSLKNVKKSLHWKRVLIALASALVVVAMGIGSAFAMQHIPKTLHANKIDVMLRQFTSGEQYLMAEVPGGLATYVTQKRIETKADGETIVSIYFRMETTVWTDLVITEPTMSVDQHMLAEINADNDIDHVYYYTGDFSDLEEMSESELEQVNQSAVLKWSK